MPIFLGSLGVLLGVMVMLAGAITFVRGLPNGVRLRPGREDPRGNWAYLMGQEGLGLGVVLLALDVVLRLSTRPFFVPGIILVLVPVALNAPRQWRKLTQSPGADVERRQRPPAD